MSAQPAQPALIVSGHNVCFVDEPALNGEGLSPRLPTLGVVRENSLPKSGDYAERSAWLAMSGRRGRYAALKPFESCGPGDEWCLEVEGVVVFRWHTGNRCISYRALEDYRPERLRFWVLHTLFPVMLTLERFCETLHVGAVLGERGALLFSAPSFGGKSTLTHYCVERGMPLVADDSLALKQLGDEYLALPSYPFLRHYRRAEDLGEPVTNRVEEPVPVRALCRLQRVGPNEPVHVTPLTGARAYEAVHDSLFAGLSFMRVEQFRSVAAVADSLDIVQLSLPWTLERLEQVHETLCAL